MNRKLLFMVVMVAMTSVMLFGQTKEELTAQKAEKAAEVATLQGQIDALNGDIANIDAQLLEWPRWEAGAFGVIGLDLNGFSDWLAREQPNTNSASIAIALNAFGNRLTKKSFWRNAANLNMGWLRFDDKDNPDDNSDFQQTADVINLTSLYGYKFSDKLAASTLGEYRSTILSNFNNPGYLDIGAGVTWTPVKDLVVVVHPLNYNIVFAEEGSTFESSLGAKIVIDYTKEVTKGVNWKSNLSAFQSYKSGDLSNWTWVNGVGFNIWKGIGIGAELGLRNNKQEAIAAGLEDNPLQTYYVLGISYNVGTK